MRYRWAIPTLLAVPFLVLACSDTEQAALLEPPVDSRDVTTQAAPLEGQFDASVKYPLPQCNNDATQVNGDWEISRGSGNVCLYAHVTTSSGDDVTRGQVVWEACLVSRKVGVSRSKEDCAAGNGVWLKLPGQGGGTKVDANGVATLGSLSTGTCGGGDSDPSGFRYQFKGGGQVRGGMSSPFNITVVACE